MFLTPAGIWMGAHVSYHEWWLWNQIPVTLGIWLGGLLFVGLPMLWMAPSEAPAAMIENEPQVKLQEP